MRKLKNTFNLGTELIAALLMAAIFITFLVQIVLRKLSKFGLDMQIGWSVDFTAALWLTVVFFGCAFVVRERDHVKFDIIYTKLPHKIRLLFTLISATAIVLAMVYSFADSYDYIDWMKRKKSAFPGVSMRTVLFVYIIFMVGLIVRYTVVFISILYPRLFGENRDPAQKQKEVEQ